MFINLLQRIVDFIFALIPYDLPSSEQLDHVKIVAHRGWHDNLDIKENTMKAFDLALQNQIYGIEFDIRWTKDLVPVVHHDMSLSRLFGSDQDISQLNFQQLRHQFPEIPSLAEVVQRFGSKIHFFIELKKEFFPNLIKQKDILQQVLSPLKPVEDFHLITLEDDVFLKFNSFDKRCYILVAVFNVLELSQKVIENNWGGIAGHYLLISNKIASKHHSLNQFVGTGYPASNNCFKREIRREVDYIFTNHPNRILLNLQKLKKNRN